MTNGVLLILVAAFVTFVLRAAPFAIFGGDREMPEFVQRVADLMPAAIIAVLVIYCIKADIVTLGMGTVSSLISVVAVVVLHLWKRNILFSIFGGTVLYMSLLHLLSGII